MLRQCKVSIYFRDGFNHLRKTLSHPAKYLDIKSKDLPQTNNITTIVGKDSPIQLESKKSPK